MTDVRETGPRGLRYGEGTLDNNSSDLNFEELMANIDSFKKIPTSLLSLMFKPTYSEPIGVKLAQVDYGKSSYDKNAVSDWDLANLNEVRAVNQPGILQLLNGNMKMITTGITTFLNGTVGFLYGLGTGAFNELGWNGKNKDGTEKTFLLGLWDNSFNKIMTDILDVMEEIAPNYYSQAELNSPWYTNILSPNFIGDKVMKNMGFTSGALGALAVTRGTGVLGGIGKGALTLTKFTFGGLGKVMGASRGTLANINAAARGIGLITNIAVSDAIASSGESSIEAINAVKEGSKDAYRNLEIRRLELINSLDPASPDYAMNLKAIDDATEQYKQEINSKLRDVGNSVYLANMAILSVSNILEFLPILRGGFQRSAKLTDFELRANGLRATTSDFVNALLRGELVGIENTVNKGWGRVAGIAAKNALIEGSEEAAQNLASNSRQLQAKARLNEYAEDTLLGYRINPEATEELVNYTKAFSKALYDNFGSPESQGWEEFFLGALTGGIGFIGLSPHAVKNEQGEYVYDPKTGKRKTSWKPRTIGDWLQGGIMYARRAVNEEYEDNQTIVDAVNQRLSDPEFIKRTQHAIGSKALANEMQAALDANDIFTFKNSEIGKLVNDVFFFRDKGMIDEYKDIYRNFTNIDDKTLQLLYAATSDLDGNTLLSLEDMSAVRQEYQDKAKRNLEKILIIQDYYDFVDLEYRDRSPLFKEELAYQYIRLDDTRRRIRELEEKKKSPSKFKSLLPGLRDYVANPNDWDGTTPTRDAYIENIESDNGLTETEQKDLERLKRQEKQYQRKIDRVKEKPVVVDLWANRAYNKAKRKHESLDAQGLIDKIKNAQSVSEIDGILSSADESVRQEVINTAYQEGDNELKQKLQGLISAATAYTKTRSRLKKAGWKKESAELMESLMLNLLYLVYMNNNMNLSDVNKALKQIHQELNEDSVATIAEYLPDAYGVFENSFTGEENKQEKGILLDVLEGAIEDVLHGILNGEAFRVQQETLVRVNKQRQQAELKKLQKEEKKKLSILSWKLAVNATTYIKQIENIDSYQKEFESLGVAEIEQAIADAIGAYADNEAAVKNALKLVKQIIGSSNPQEKLLAAINRNFNKDGNHPELEALILNLSKLISKSSTAASTTSKNLSFKDLMNKLRKADKNKDADTVNSIISQILSDPLKYMSQGAKDNDFDYIGQLKDKYKGKKISTSGPTLLHQDGEVTSETIEKDGVKITKFTLWRQSKKSGKVVAITGGGLQIDTDSIDPEYLDADGDIEDIEKIVLTELREKDGKFGGTIRYSIKGQKGRLKAGVKFTRDPRTITQTEKKKSEGDTVGGSPVALSYLLENGPRTIKSTGYLLHAISAAFEANTEEIEKIRNKYLLLLDDNPENFKNDKTGALKEIRDLINNTYGIDGMSILDEILNNATGFYAKEGNKIASRLEKLNSLIKDEEKNQELSIIPASTLESLVLLEKFYEQHDIDPNDLSTEELQSIVDKLEKAIELINLNKEIPQNLQVYADLILAEKGTHPIVTELEGTPNATSANANELNGAYRGLYDVGNVSEGRANLLQEMNAQLANEDALMANYETIQHAEQVQWCIDNLLKLLPKDTTVNIISTVDRTYNTGLRITYTAVKATSAIKNKAKNRWIVETNDGEYIIIGTLGYNGSNSEQANYWNSIREDLDKQIENAGVTEGYWVSNNDRHSFRINNIGDGRPAKTQYQHSSTRSVVELIEGSDKGRNPQGITLKNLKWLIIYTDEPKSVNVSSNDRVRGKAKLGLGKVYVLVPSPSGVYYRHPVAPITIDEINRNSKLFKTIDKLIEDVIKNKKIIDVLALKGMLVLEREAVEESYLNIYFNDAGIRVQYKPREGAETSFTLNEDENTAIDQLKDIIYNTIRPFVSVNLAHLGSPATVRMLDEAGALQLKEPLAMFSYVGANYTVIPANTVTNSKQAKRQRTSLENQEEEIQYNGRVFKRNGQYYRNDTLITDPLELEILRDIDNINLGVYTAETLYKWKKKKGKWEAIPMEGDYYFVLKGNLTTIYHKDIHGNITKIDSDKVISLLDARKKKPKESRSIEDAEVVEETDFELDTTGAEELDDEAKAIIEAGKKASREQRKASKQKEFEESNVIEIDVPTTEGGTKKEKVQKIKYTDIKEGDIIWYTGPESSTVTGRMKITAIDNGDAFGEGLLPKNRIAYYRVVFNTELLESQESKEDKQTKVEARKQDAVSRATYDLELKKGIKIGDTVEVPLAKGRITRIVFDSLKTPLKGDPYSYSDIYGTVILEIETESGKIIRERAEDFIKYPLRYKKINKQSQKSLNLLDIQDNSSTFVNVLKDSAIPTSTLEDILYDKAISIAENKGIDFDEDCSIDDLISWYKDNVGFDLTKVPSNANPETLEELIDNCK